MTADRIAEVKTWLERMGAPSWGPAINLSKRMSPEDPDESSDLFWALAKYADNVQEPVVQLDRVNTKVYPALVELGEGTWKGLKECGPISRTRSGTSTRRPCGLPKPRISPGFARYCRPSWS